MKRATLSNPRSLISKVLCACALFTVVAVHPNVAAIEKILEFHSDISVQADRSLFVRETILVNAEGRQIRRGIYRDFPTDYKDKLGNRYRVKFDVKNVMKNGLAEPFKTKRIGNGVRVYIGREDVMLTPGQYRYEITYRTDRQLGFFDKHDELYWNVTGTGWAFPIEMARATIKLPTYVEPSGLSVDGYTGPQGATDKNYAAHIDDLSVAHFSTTTRLKPYEGLTIVLAWPKGIITPPSPNEIFAETLEDNAHLISALLGSFGLAFFYLFTWSKVGRDPEQGVIVAEYEPPPGYSPASMRFIEKMAYDPKCFTAALINLAVKGYLNIHEENNQYSLERTGKQVELAPGEQTLADSLFSSGDIKVLMQSNHSSIRQALKNHEQALQADYENKYFKTNRKFFIVGVILSIAVVIVTAILGARNTAATEAIFLSVWASIWWFGTGASLLRSWHSLKYGNGTASKIRAIINAIFLVPFIGVGIFVLTEFGGATNWSVIFFLLFLVGMNILFYQLLKAPTLLGRKLLDKVEGFRHYVDIAEKHELNYKNPAGRTPELFERYLPYALALGIEQKWSEQFHEVLAASAAEGNSYAPGWYNGSHWHVNQASHFSSRLGGSLTGAIASSSTAPGSSSGSGGGGSSGGGGGGGGGGGW